MLLDLGIQYGIITGARTSPSVRAQASLESAEACSGSTQACLPSAQVKAAAARVQMKAVSAK